VEVGWEIYVGAAACVSVFALGAWEFIKRIVSGSACMPYTCRMSSASNAQHLEPCMTF
jgi:hypothetical protein